MKVSIAFENDSEKFEVLHNVLCNGLSNFSSYGIEIECLEYKRVRQQMHNENPNEEIICFEDVLVEVIKRGKSIKFVDVECDGEYSVLLTKELFMERIEEVPANYLMEVMEERDDAETCDCILQYILYKELVFC